MLSASFKTKRTAAASRGSIATARLSCFVMLMHANIWKAQSWQQSCTCPFNSRTSFDVICPERCNVGGQFVRVETSYASLYSNHVFFIYVVWSRVIMQLAVLNTTTWAAARENDIAVNVFHLSRAIPPDSSPQRPKSCGANWLHECNNELCRNTECHFASQKNNLITCLVYMLYWGSVFAFLCDHDR